MTKMDRTAQEHLRQYYAMVRSGEWDRYVKSERNRVAAINAKQGHSPKCGILKCHPDCRAGRK